MKAIQLKSFDALELERKLEPLPVLIHRKKINIRNLPNKLIKLYVTKMIKNKHADRNSHLLNFDNKTSQGRKGRAIIKKILVYLEDDYLPKNILNQIGLIIDNQKF